FWHCTQDKCVMLAKFQVLPKIQSNSGKNLHKGYLQNIGRRKAKNPAAGSLPPGEVPSCRCSLLLEEAVLPPVPILQSFYRQAIGLRYYL
ncbi:MAG TPA: hypothetical protein VJ734_05660, partial [Nitrosospira sp.]|nr:hypothetical protein [Nitrosospira sp.]